MLKSMVMWTQQSPYIFLYVKNMIINELVTFVYNNLSYAEVHKTVSHLLVCHYHRNAKKYLANS